MKKIWNFLFVGLAVWAFAGEAAAAACKSTKTGSWGDARIWDCGKVPGANDSVTIGTPFKVTLARDSSAASLNIEAGATLVDNGKDLTVSGSVTIDGTYDGTGNNGTLIMTGNGQTLSGTGSVIDIKRIQIDGNTTIPAGSNLNLTLQSEIRIGSNNPATLTIDGTITGTSQSNGNRIIRIDNNNASNVIVNGTINAPNSFVEIQANGTLTNNGSVSLQYLDGDKATSATWTQGANSSLTLSQSAQSWKGTFNASATGNTVTYISPAVPITPSNNTYYNLEGTGVVCPSTFTILGSSPCSALIAPVVEYRMDETSPGAVVDSSANALNGTAVGGITVGGAGKVCGSYNFNGTDAYVSVADNALLKPTKVSVAAWVRHDSAAFKNWEAILAKGDTSYRMHLNGGCSLNTPTTNALDFGLNTGCSTADVSSTTVPVANQWYHAVGTYDGAMLRLYINGALVGSVAYAGSVAANTFPLYIGANSQQAGRFWSGDLDEVKIYNAALTATQVSTIYANENAGKNWDGTARTCVGPHHIQIEHDGAGLTCSAETVTIKACANAACTTLYTGGASVTLSPGGQTFTIDNTGINNAASVQQSTATTATLSAVSIPAVVDATTPTTCLNTATSTTSCSMAFSDSGFVVTAPDHVSCNNASVTIEAVQAAPGSGRCVPTYRNVTRAVKLYTAYTAPATGSMAATASADGGANWFTVSTSAPGAAQNLSFDNTGKATLLLNYQDAGKLTLNATDTAPTGAAMSGSGTFVVAPASFVFSGIPAAPLTAGQAFNVTVTAQNACATPAKTSNFTSQTVTITSSNPQPALGNAAAINTSLAATSGTGSVNLTWNEVGTIDLNANLSNYLGSTLSISGSQANVGRFKPAYFDTTISPVSNVPMGCPAGLVCPAAYNGFVYSGQSFSVKVAAKSLAGNTTKNYQGTTYAQKVALTAWDALGSTTTENPGGGTLTGATIVATDFASGEATAGAVTYTLAAAPSAPKSIYLRARESSGTDNVTSLRAMPGSSVEGGVTVASGRLQVTNAYGSELAKLTLQALAQYYDGAAWKSSSTDNASSLTIAAAYDVMNGATKTGTTVPNPTGAATLTGGVLSIVLGAPGAGVTGTATVSPTAPAYLPVTAGAATFGVYKGSREFIYQRER